MKPTQWVGFPLVDVAQRMPVPGRLVRWWQLGGSSSVKTLPLGSRGG